MPSEMPGTPQEGTAEMADDTSTETTDTGTTSGEGDTTTETTTTAKPGETSSTAGGDDVSGLKSALDTERTQRKAYEKELKALRARTEKVEKASMSDAEKAIADAKAEGRTAAATEYGKKLAGAELRAAAAAKGVDLSALGDLIDVSRFVGEDGDVDTDAIDKAVAKLAKISPAKPAPPRGSGEFPGGTGDGSRITEEQLAGMSSAEIAAAYNAGKLSHLM